MIKVNEANRIMYSFAWQITGYLLTITRLMKLASTLENYNKIVRELSWSLKIFHPILKVTTVGDCCKAVGLLST